MATKTILEVEESLQSALEALPAVVRTNPSNPASQQLVEALKVLAPDGYHPVVELQQEDGRRKRRTASAENWTPATGKILISFDKDDTPARPQVISAPPSGPDKGSRVPNSNESARKDPVVSSSPGAGKSFEDPRERDLCRALDEAEREGLAFVALKRFRDILLPAKGYAWATEAEQRQAVLAAAIEKGLVVTSRIPNPRSPFPTTTVRLNRTRLGGQSEGHRYSPIRIQGEPLSSTILRDRGAY